MRKSSEDFNRLVLLKDKFSNALEIGDMKNANEILDSIDGIFHDLSGKSFRENLSKDDQIKLNRFMKSGEKRAWKIALKFFNNKKINLVSN